MGGVPFGSLVAQRSRVLPQGGAVLGQLTGTFAQGLEQGRARAAEDAAPNDLMNYLDTLGANYQQPRLGALAPTGPATGYVAGEGTAPTYNGTPTRENAATQAALTPGDPTFDGRFAMRRENASQQNPPAPAAPYATNIAGYGSGLNTTGLDPTFGTGLDSAIQAYIAAGGDPATVQINSLVRSTEEQQRLYDQYQRGEIGLAAPPGSSRHEYGAAADIQSGPFLDWLTQNASQYGLSFLQGNAYAADPGHVQLAGPSPAGTRAPAIPAGSTTQAGGGYSAQPAWSPPTGAERQALRALIMNPATRETGMQLAIERMTPPAPTTPNYGFTEVGGVLYATDPTTGRAVPVAGGQSTGPTWQPITDPATGWTGRQNTATGDVEWNPQGMQPQAPNTGEPPTDVQIYDYYVQQETRDGRTPKSFNEWDLERRGRLGGIDPTVAEQRYALLYQNAARELPILEQTWASLGDLGNQAAERLPAIIGNWVVSPEYQRAVSAMTQIVQMQTYALTGAAATTSEAERIARTLLPAIGDGPGVIADKLQRTRDAINFIRGASGGAAGPASPAAAAPVATPAPTGTPLAPGQPVPPALYEWDPTTNTLVPVSPR